MSDLQETLQILESQSINDFRRHALIKILLPYIEGKRVLDVGCGMGFMTEKLVSMNINTISLDTEYLFVKHTVSRVKNSKQSPSGVNYSGETLPFSNDSFDTILVLDVMEHVENDDLFIRELWRVLAINGLLIIVVPAVQLLYGKRDKALGHYRRYSKKGLTILLDNSIFKINYLNYWNFVGFFPYAFSERILHRELSDKIRKGNLSKVNSRIAKFLSIWLIFESRLYIPIGLSLIAISKKIEGSNRVTDSAVSVI